MARNLKAIQTNLQGIAALIEPTSPKGEAEVNMPRPLKEIQADLKKMAFHINAGKYNHAYDIAFEVISDTEDGSDVTPEMLRSAILKRLNGMDDDELLEACGAPFDTDNTEWIFDQTDDETGEGGE